MILSPGERLLWSAVPGRGQERPGEAGSVCVRSRGEWPGVDQHYTLQTTLSHYRPELPHTGHRSQPYTCRAGHFRDKSSELHVSQLRQDLKLRPVSEMLSAFQ